MTGPSRTTLRLQLALVYIVHKSYQYQYQVLGVSEYDTMYSSTSMYDNVSSEYSYLYRFLYAVLVLFTGTWYSEYNPTENDLSIFDGKKSFSVCNATECMSKTRQATRDRRKA